METFTEPKDFVSNPNYFEQRRKCLSRLDISSLDEPIVEIIEGFAELDYCFTIQSCHGHFLYSGQMDERNEEPLPISDDIRLVEYKIGYLALCLENSAPGRMLFHDLSLVPAIDPEYIQFGCAEWFWQQQVNSYVLQVEPKRYMTRDRISIDYQEALHLEKVRSEFFKEIRRIIARRLTGP